MNLNVFTCFQPRFTRREDNEKHSELRSLNASGKAVTDASIAVYYFFNARERTVGPSNPHAADVAAARAWTERGGGGWLLCGGGGGGK